MPKKPSATSAVVFFTEPERYFAPEIIDDKPEFVTEKEFLFNDEKYYNVIYPAKNSHLFMEMKPKTIIKNNKVSQYCSECYLCIRKIENDFENRPLHKSCHFDRINNKWYNLQSRKLKKYDGSFFIDMRN